jgi:hypothetical protein
MVLSSFVYHFSAMATEKSQIIRRRDNIFRYFKLTTANPGAPGLAGGNSTIAIACTDSA